MQAMFTPRMQTEGMYADTVEVFLQDGEEVILLLLAFVFAFALVMFTREASTVASASHVQEN